MYGCGHQYSLTRIVLIVTLVAGAYLSPRRPPQCEGPKGQEGPLPLGRRNLALGPKTSPGAGAHMVISTWDRELELTLLTCWDCSCVRYDNGWWTRDGCRVVNNLLLGVDRHVDCVCERLAVGYAVLTEAPRAPSTVGYTIWFHVICFCCIVSFINVEKQTSL